MKKTHHEHQYPGPHSEPHGPHVEARRARRRIIVMLVLGGAIILGLMILILTK